MDGDLDGGGGFLLLDVGHVDLWCGFLDLGGNALDGGCRSGAGAGAGVPGPLDCRPVSLCVGRGGRDGDGLVAGTAAVIGFLFEIGHGDDPGTELLGVAGVLDDTAGVCELI